MNRTLAAAFALMGLASAAAAADMPLKAAPPADPSWSWNGCYVGGNVGWGRASNDLSTFVPAASAIVPAARTAITNAGLASIDGDGFTGGGQIGCNRAIAALPVVLGVEADFNFIDADASRNTGNFVEAVSGRTVRSIDRVGMDWFSTVRGRLGHAKDRFLLFATGGLAIASPSISRQFAWDFADGCTIVNVLQECHVGGVNDTRVGWTVGGGIEWAYNANWSFKAEYLYIDLGNVSYQTANNGAAILPAVQNAIHTVNTNMQIVRVGFNYRFGAPPP